MLRASPLSPIQSLALVRCGEGASSCSHARLPLIFPRARAPPPPPPPPPATTVTAGATSVDEGKTVTFTVSGAAGAEISYTLAGTAANSADLNSPLNGVVKLDSFGKATVIVDVKADATTEGAETLNLVLSNGAKVTADVAVNDVSLTPAAVAKTFTLTTGVDAVADFTGTAADDTYNARATNPTTGAAATTVNDGDTLDGGLGKDTLNITATADNNRSLTGLATSNIETINIAGATTTHDTRRQIERCHHIITRR